MTEKQSHLFSKLLDANWELKEAVENEDYIQAYELQKRVSLLKSELRADMGSEAYDKFIENGRKMFQKISDN
jgi:hypothetical protein